MAERTAADAPRRVVVIGAGMVGLSTAWYLQERDIEVVVVDRAGVAAGSSWGNAGWISPGLAIPLADPSVLRYGLKSLLDKHSPLYVPFAFDPALWRFLLAFARRCTMRTWRRTMADYVPVNRVATEAYDELAAGGVTGRTIEAPIMAAFRTVALSAGLTKEIEQIHRAGLDLKTETIDGDALRAEVPIVARDVQTAIKISGQRYIDPGHYVDSLADAVRDRGGQIVTGASVRALRQGPGGFTVEMYGGDPVRGDAVVIATGAWLPELARQYGVKVQLRAGRGYSFSVPVSAPVPCPVYFPHERVACTPLGDRLRVAGTMEFRDVDAPLDLGRVDSIVRSGKPLLSGVDWNDRQDVWVGGRPVTVDGLPLVGVTRNPRVYVAGGHGMWGITLGPITGKLLAQEISTGSVPDLLRPFDPLR
ncbi:MAG TPA: FAD-dependent oxidoreductase [Nakamurella sp.]|jgi:D-amino-acid dehydrogenase|nr:FAD-dependent oxidoreductase [Nakamurella sp.]